MLSSEILGTPCATPWAKLVSSDQDGADSSRASSVSLYILFNLKTLDDIA